MDVGEIDEREKREEWAEGSEQDRQHVGMMESTKRGGQGEIPSVKFLLLVNCVSHSKKQNSLCQIAELLGNYILEVSCHA